MKNVTEMKPKKEVTTLTPEKCAALMALDRRRKQQGFSLIELLVVVAIMLVIAAIAVPSLLKSKTAANQASAVGSLHTLSNMAAEYDSAYGNGFPAKIEDLGSIGGTTASCTNAGLIDSALAASSAQNPKSGYVFTLTPGATQVTSNTSSCTADLGYSDGDAFIATPASPSTGNSAYCVDMSQNVIYQYQQTTAPTATNGICPTNSGTNPAVPVGN